MAFEVIISFEFLLAFCTGYVALVGMHFSCVNNQLRFVKKLKVAELAGKTSSPLLVNFFIMTVQTPRICKMFGTEGTHKDCFSLHTIVAGNVALFMSFKNGLCRAHDRAYLTFQLKFLMNL